MTSCDRESFAFFRQQVLSAGEAQQQIDAAKAEMIAVKEKMERERERQEAELHKRLSTLKHKRLTDLEKQHDLETKEYDKKCQSMQTQGPIGKVLKHYYIEDLT